MMRSLYSGVAGLKTHQIKMDVIGNNIANVNTTAFKSQSITFSDMLYQTTQAASGANANSGLGGTNARQIGLGAKSGAISTAITSQGSAQTTNNPFDIMITGDAFFVVSKGAGQPNLFTRDGSFRVDGAGNLVMASTGYTLMGWQADDEGNIIADTVSPLRVMSPDKLTYPPEATSKGMVTGILDKNDTNVHSTNGKIVSLALYDNLGYKYNARFSIHATNAEAGEYYIRLDEIADSNGKRVDNEADFANFGQTITVNGSASYKKIDEDNYKLEKDTSTTPPTYELQTIGGTAVDLNPPYLDVLAAYGAAGKYYDTSASPATLLPQYSDLKVDFDPDTGSISVTYKEEVQRGAFINFDPNTGNFAGIGTSAAGLTEDDSVMQLTFKNGNFSTINIDFSTSTMFNNGGTSTIGGTNGDVDGLGSGRKLGEMSGISIARDGIISASYDNGQMRILGQIAVATFPNAAGLAKEGDNLYDQTMNSGEFDGIGVDITAGGGYMTTGVLEMSNVDLSGEFTEMITTQRGFQANSRIISVSDSLLEELVNLKR